MRLSSLYSHQKFLFFGGFLAPWSMASTFGIAADANAPADQFLLVLTAPLLEWQLSAAPAVGAAAAATRSNALDAEQPSVPIDPKRVRF